MEIQVSKLREALKLLEPVVPKKSALPIVEYVYLGNGRARATDLEIAVSVDLPEADEPMLLPAVTALAFLENAPGHRMAKLTVKGREVGITVGDTEAQWTTNDAADFPPIERRDFEHDTVLNGEALVKALVTVVDCSAKEDTRPLLHGICLSKTLGTETAGENVEVVGADGFQLGVERVPGKLPGEKPLIIPRDVIRHLERLWKKASAPDLTGVETPAQLAMAKRPIRLEYNGDALQIHFGRVTMLIKLIQGTYPNYTKLIPTNFTSTVTVYAEDITRALRQVERIAEQSSGIVRLAWEGSNLRVSVRAAEVGTSSTNVPAKSSAPGRIAMNVGYLQNWFSQLQGETSISITGDAGPVKFTHRETTRVVMPMAVQWDGDGMNGVPAVQVAETVPTNVSTNTPTDASAEATPDMPANESNNMPDKEEKEETKKPRKRKPKVPATS